MCGIAGSVHRSRPADWQRMRHALTRLAHRGPDGEGILGIDFDGNVAATEGAASRVLFGFRRLAIFDLSLKSDQPMLCAVTGNVLVFNGAIYNFLELRDELRALGHRFVSEGDAEVILAAYRAWGVHAFTKFNGMWAVALYDAATGDVLLCRDRLGIKPLYYKQHGDGFFFASEMRALMQLINHQPGVDAGMAFDFLAGVMVDHAEQTLWEGVNQLPAGALWRITRAGEVQRGAFHRWPEHIAEQRAEDVHRLLEDAVRLRLRADVPTVSLLSGGLDSSSITWLAVQQREQPRTQFSGAFSYGYESEHYAAHDEIAQATALVEALPGKIVHTVVRANPRLTVDELLALTGTQEHPSTTPSILASWRLYRSIRARGVKVALSGEGADELFGGYTRLYMPLLARDCLRQGRMKELASLLRSPHLPLRGLGTRLAWGLPMPVLMQLLQQRSNMMGMRRGFKRAQQARFAAILAQHALPLRARLRQDVLQYGLPQILRYADRNSMASGVEVRLPFLDYRLVELALAAPPAQHVQVAGGKQLLRQAMRGYLPPEVLAHPKTHGFGHAEQYQLHQLDIAALVERAPEETWEYLDREALLRQSRKPSLHPMAWLPLSFMLWTTARAEGRFA